MTHKSTRFVTLVSRTLPLEAMRLPNIDLALVWFDTSPFRDFEDLAYSTREGLLVTFELQPGLTVETLDAWLGPDDRLQESWAGTSRTFGTARIALQTCARWLSAEGRAVVARFETALMWRDQRGSPSADSRRASAGPSHTWRAEVPSPTAVVGTSGSLRAPGTPSDDGTAPPLAKATSLPVRGLVPSTPPPDSTTAVAHDLWIVVDDGCPWARSDLRLPNGCSRLRSLWYQQAPDTTIEHTQALPHSWAGRYWDTSRMNDWLSRAGHDPAAAYAEWGDGHLMRRTSHGAHILGLLLGRAGDMLPPHDVTVGPDSAALATPAGKARASAGPAGPDLVFVQLPRSVRSTVSRAALTPWVLEGIAHGVQHAAAARRAVATLSLESYDGPHDGSSLFEAGVQALIDQARDRQQLDLRVVLAAGNAHQRQVAATLDLQPGRPTELKWEAVPGCERAAWLELWCPADQPLPDLQVAAPGHEPSGALGTGEVWAWPSRDTAVCAVLMPAAPRAGGRLVWVRLAPTQVFQPGEPAAPCGIWRLILTSEASVRVHAYLARVWPGPGGQPSGRQGRLWVGESDSSNLQRAASPAMPGSISGMACGGPDVTVVGGSWMQAPPSPPTPHESQASGPPAGADPLVPYVGRGPARGGWRARAPALDALAPSEESRGLPGVRSTGHLDASTSRMGGTSVAVPLHARTLMEPPQQETPPP
jgi:hypothetical protein